MDVVRAFQSDILHISLYWYSGVARVGSLGNQIIVLLSTRECPRARFSWWFGCLSSQEYIGTPGIPTCGNRQLRLVAPTC
eukprot:762913-Rhodomonas_salina.2